MRLRGIEFPMNSRMRQFEDRGSSGMLYPGLDVLSDQILRVEDYLIISQQNRIIKPQAVHADQRRSPLASF